MHAIPPDILPRLLAGKWPAESSPKERAPDPFGLILWGFMPALLTLDSLEACTRSWEGYVATHLERDLRHISQVDSLRDFHRVIEFLALGNGQVLNQSEVARDAVVSQPTVHRYLNLLETTYLIERLPPYTTGCTKRLIKSPKLYWTDLGLAAFLSGYHEREVHLTACGE